MLQNNEKSAEVLKAEKIVEQAKSVTADSGYGSEENYEYLEMEDFEESLRKEDEDTLSGLRMQQVYSVTYPAEEAKSVREIMQKWMASFGGKLGSDTEDFAPFLTIEEL